MIAIGYIRFLLGLNARSMNDSEILEAGSEPEEPIQWIVSESPLGLDLPDWLITAGFDEGGEIYLAAGLGVMEFVDDLWLVEEHESVIARAAVRQQRKVIVHDKHFYVPVAWLRENYPKMPFGFDVEKARRLLKIKP